MNGRTLFISCVLSLSSAANAATGSWQGTTKDVWLRLADREVVSELMSPPALAQGRHMGAVRWQFSLPPLAAVDVWLCHPQHCVPLKSVRGQTHALTGLNAEQPLQFRFVLRERGTTVAVQGAQVLVEYR